MCTSFFADAFYRRCRNLRWSMSRTTKLATNLKHQRAAMQSYPHGQATCFRRSLGNYNSLEEQQSLEKYHVFKCRIALYSRKSYHVNLECDFATLRSGESDSFHIYIYTYIYIYIHIYIYIYTYVETRPCRNQSYIIRLRVNWHIPIFLVKT